MPIYFPTNSAQEDSFCPHDHVLLSFILITSVRWYLIMVLICLFLMIGEADHFLYACWSFVCLFFYCCFLFTKLLSTLCDPWTVAHQAPQSMGFFRQEYWMACHFLLQRIFLAQGLNKPMSPAWQVDSLPVSQRESPSVYLGSVCSHTLLILKSGCLFQPYGKPYEASSQI